MSADVEMSRIVGGFPEKNVVKEKILGMFKGMSLGECLKENSPPKCPERTNVRITM